MKKGFTFVELMMALLTISIITAILYPTLASLAPNNNAHLFKSAYRTVEEFVANTDISSIDVSGNAATNFCTKFSQAVNTRNIACPNFETVNGFRWHINYTASVFDILVDVNQRNNSKDNMDDNTGAVHHCNVANAPWNTGCIYDDDDNILSDTFEILVDRSGRITVTDPIARQYLQETYGN